MSIGLILFFSVIVIAAVAAVCVLSVYLERNFPNERFDERQKIARGSAYRFSLAVGNIYYLCLVIYLIMHTGKSEWAVEPFVLVMIGFLLQELCFHIYCLMTHSALPLGEKPVTMILCYSILGGMYLINFSRFRIDGNPVGVSGYESYGLFWILLSVSFFSLAVLHLIAFLRKEEE